MVISDLHSTFLDEKAFKVWLQVYKDNHFDRIVLNGDTLDFPTVSEHAQKLEHYAPHIIDNYSLDEELDFTIEKIIQPIHRAHPEVPMLLRLGNHCERFLRPNKANARAVADILDTSRRRGTTRLEDMLRLDKYNATLSYNGVDRYHKFTFIHGVSTAPGAPTVNLKKYGSGTSGHSHRMGSTVETFYKGRRSWNESGCLRTITDVEYLPRGDVPNWCQGFLTLYFDKRNPDWFACDPHIIQKYQCEFHGTKYS